MYFPSSIGIFQIKNNVSIFLQGKRSFSNIDQIHLTWDWTEFDKVIFLLPRLHPGALYRDFLIKYNLANIMSPP